MDTDPRRVHCIASNCIRQHRTPTWCEVVSTLASVAGALIGLFELLRG